MVKIPYHYQQNTGDNQDQFHGYHISHRTKEGWQEAWHWQQ